MWFLSDTCLDVDLPVFTLLLITKTRLELQETFLGHTCTFSPTNFLLLMLNPVAGMLYPSLMPHWGILLACLSFITGPNTTTELPCSTSAYLFIYIFVFFFLCFEIFFLSVNFILLPELKELKILVCLLAFLISLNLHDIFSMKQAGRRWKCVLQFY